MVIGKPKPLVWPAIPQDYQRFKDELSEDHALWGHPVEAWGERRSADGVYIWLRVRFVPLDAQALRMLAVRSPDGSAPSEVVYAFSAAAVDALNQEQEGE